MAITRVGTETINNSSSSRDPASFSHTTTADTDLLLVCVLIEGNEAVNGTPTFDGNDLTLIRDTGSTGSNGDVRVYVYGMVSPGAVTGTVSVDFTSSVNPSAVACINYKGTDTITVGLATNFINEDVNTSGTSTGVHASGGTSGNALFVVGCGQGADMQPASVDNSFVEVWDQQTGTSNSSDFGHIGAEKLSSIPSAVTITYGATDENTSVLIELLVPGIDPAIADVETDEDYDDKDTAVTITGGRFEASQGTGKVEMGDDPDYATAAKVEQTVTSWADTAIDFTADLGAQSPGGKWLFVTNDTGDKNDPGFAVTVHRAQAFAMSASANIAASGEATTVQLTAPAGKTTGDFDAGRIQDDENPADSVDVTLDDYTEMEWAIEATADARAVQYDFRITKAGVVLDTYTVTPKLTITGGGDETLAANSGSYALTGTVANTEYHRVIAAAAGAYTWTGTAAATIKNIMLTAAGGSYAWTGTPAGFRRDRVLSAEGGSFTETGTAANTEYHRVLDAATGAYAWTGTAAGTAKGFVIAAAGGVYAWTGTVAGTLHDRVLAAAAGAYAWTGAAAGLLKDSVLAAAAGAYSWTGLPAALSVAVGAAPGTGALADTGASAVRADTGASGDLTDTGGSALLTNTGPSSAFTDTSGSAVLTNTP